MNDKQIKSAAIYLALLILLYCAILNIPAILGFLESALILLSPMLVGLSLAFIINIPMSVIERRLLFGIKRNGIKRIIAILLTIVVISIVIAFVVFMLKPALANSVEKLMSAAQAFATNVSDFIIQLSKKYPTIMGNIQYLEIKDITKITDTQALINTILNFIKGGIQSIGGGLNFIVSTFNSILSVFFAIMFAIYTLISKELMKNGILRILNVTISEKNTQKIKYVARTTKDIFTKFVTGQCLEAIIVGLLFFITLAILGYPYPPLIGVTISATALIPYIGPLIGCIISTFLILMEDPVKALWFIVIFLILQQIEGNLVYPRVVGDSVGLPPFWVLLAVIVGTGLFGMVGLITFIPLFSILYKLLWEKVASLEKKAKDKIERQAMSLENKEATDE